MEELAVIIQDGLRRMFAEGEEIFYYLSAYNEEYTQPAMPEDSRDGILQGMYRVSSAPGEKRVQLFGSGPILREALRAQQLLREHYGVGSDVWSVTSYSELRRGAMAAERHNRLNPDQPAQRSYLEETLSGVSGPFISTSDNLRLVADQIRQWIPGEYIVLGTDGFGRSETRDALRRHFEVDAESVVLAALSGLARSGQMLTADLSAAVEKLGLDPRKIDAVMA